MTEYEPTKEEIRQAVTEQNQVVIDTYLTLLSDKRDLLVSAQPALKHAVSLAKDALENNKAEVRSIDSKLSLFKSVKYRGI